jgi:hypothetical protein
LARRFGIAHGSLDRHWENCVPDRLPRPMGEADADGARIMDGRYLLETMTGLVAQAEVFAGEVRARWEAKEPGIHPEDMVRALCVRTASSAGHLRLSRFDSMCAQEGHLTHI